MSRRTIQSPGVEIREIDLTSRPAAPVGTNVFVTGYSNQGPTDEVLEVGSFSDFENIYGKPTNAAERYFYHSVGQVFNSDANVFVSRLPYGAGTGLDAAENKYTALVYPVVSPKTFNITGLTSDTAVTLSETVSGTGTGDVSVELITKDSNGDTKYTSVTSTASFGTSALSSLTLPTGISAETLVKGTVYADIPTKNGAASSLSAADYYIFGNPTQVELTQSEYNQIADGNFDWNDNANGSGSTFTSSTLLSAGGVDGVGMIILNKAKVTTNGSYEGYYVGMTDGVNVNPATAFDTAVAQYAPTSAGNITPGNFTSIADTRLDYSLSATATSNAQNVSRTLEELSDVDIDGAEFVDTLSIGLFKVRVTPFSNTDLKLSYFLAEGYTGSLNSYRKVQSADGGERKSFFIEEKDDSSPNVKILTNPYITKLGGDWTSSNSEAPKRFVRTHRTSNNATAEIQSAYYSSQLSDTSNFTEVQGIVALGAYSNEKNTTKVIGSVPSKIDRVFQIASNVDLFDIDVTPEAGLGTIWTNTKYSSNTTLTAASAFDDTAFVDLGNATTGTGFFTADSNMTVAGDSAEIRDAYREVFNKFEQFSRQTRKDNIFIADVLRNIVVQGENSKVLDDKSKNFSQHVYWPLRHQFGSANSNFATVYGNWIKVYDSTSDQQVWIPFSGNAAGLYARNDANFAPWYAPAGYNRGVVTGANDVAISPTQRQRDQLYRVAINPVTQFPNDGIIVMGQKTLQRKPSAFDRVNVRRLFLDLEKRTQKTMKSFIFEPNTFLTRTKVVNTLTPIFENAKQTEGLYDYIIVCDERNNTSARIENNELIVDIYLKPVRAAEFILVNFYSVNNDVNFEEIVG